MTLITESFLNDLQRNWANCTDQEMLRKSNIGNANAQEPISSDGMFSATTDYMTTLQQCASSGSTLNNLSLTDAQIHDISSGIFLNQKPLQQTIGFQPNLNSMDCHKLANVFTSSNLAMNTSPSDHCNGQFFNNKNDKSFNSHSSAEDNEERLLKLLCSFNSNHQGMTNALFTNNYEGIAQCLVKNQQEKLVQRPVKQFGTAELLSLLDQESAMITDNQVFNMDVKNINKDQSSLFNPSRTFHNPQLGLQNLPFDDPYNQGGTTALNQELVRNLAKNSTLNFSGLGTNQSSPTCSTKNVLSNSDYCFRESAFEPKPLQKQVYINLEKPILLSLPPDKDWITPLHCFIRRHCIEVFTADIFDVASPSKGKRRAIQIGQVGIRCPHCHHTKRTSQTVKVKERGSVYYPTNISSIYNATMNLLQRHMKSCKNIPEELKNRYLELKADDARSGTSKEYWVSSAKSLGLIDTKQGIRVSVAPLQTTQSTPICGTIEGDDILDRNFEKTQCDNEKSGLNNIQSTLVVPSDVHTATTFSFDLLSQMVPCTFTEADRLGKRKGLRIGFRGLACRHCYGGFGNGRFFPSSIKTMSDTSKTLNVLHSHVMRCRKCPNEVKEQLQKYRATHDSERAKLKFGSQKAFFAKIWKRLHGEEHDFNHQTTLQQQCHRAKRIKLASTA